MVKLLEKPIAPLQLKITRGLRPFNFGFIALNILGISING